MAGERFGRKQSAADGQLALRVRQADGVEVAHADVLYPMISPGTIIRRSHRSAEEFDLRWKIPAPSDADIKSGRWELHLRGDPTVAFRDLNREWYWACDITVKASVGPGPGPTPGT